MGHENRAVSRRTALRYGALAAGGLFAGSALSACGDDEPGGSGKGDGKGKFKIALSNAYIGNEWRKQMGEAYERACKEMQQRGSLTDFTAVHGSDNAVDAQISAVNDMILKKNDGILIVASSGSQVGGVIERAAKSGAKVVSFDAYATSDKSHNIGFDFGEWGRNNAAFIEKKLGGAGKATGNVLVVRLALGAVAGELIFEEYKKMFARNPGLKMVGEVEGQATRSVAQKNVAQILPSLPKIDAVAGAGGNDSFGIVEGFLAAGYKDRDIPPICSGADGDYIQWWLNARDKWGYEATGLNAQPEIAAWATYYMIKILEADDNTPKNFYAPSVLTTNETIDKFKDVKGQRVPVDTFTFDQVPGAFKQADKLAG